MIDTRLTQSELDAAVSFAYGGAAYRAARQNQARTIRCFFRRITGRDTPAAGTPPRARSA